MLVLSSPSGAGKSTLSHMLMERDSGITMSVSATTRPPRPGEQDGVDYYFVDKAKFNRMVAADEMLESAEVFDNFYGTPKGPVSAELESGRDVLFDVDWQGTQQLRQEAREDLVSIFILPPSMEELGDRLKKRAQDSDEVVARRMSRASDEISHWAEYDYIIVNDDIDDAIEKVISVLQVERLRRERQTGLVEFVKKLTGER